MVERRNERARGVRSLVTLASGLLVLGLSACSNEPEDLEHLVSETKRSGVKVLLIGVDGASFDLITPLVAEGRLPTFKRLLERGSHGVLKSQEPMFSPAIWTTILTGKDRQEHGILRFRVQPEGRQRRPRSLAERSALPLVSSNDRLVSAVWDITSPFGVSNGWVAFWATWPAEPMNGWSVSDRMAPSRWTEWSGGVKSEHVTYPEELAGQLRHLVVDPRAPPMGEVDELVELTPDERQEFLAVEKPIHKHWLSVFKFSYCAQRSYEKIALYLLEHCPQPDLMGTFLIANDPICHTFWHFHRPDDFHGVDPEKADRLGKLIPSFYVHNDRYLARLLSMIDPDTVVMIVSDHGFQSSGQLPRKQTLRSWDKLVKESLSTKQVAVGQSGKHHVDGVLIACGGPIRKGVTTEASVRDVTPTILALLGLPVARDMPGRALTEIFEPEFLKQHPVQRIESYERYIDRETLGARAGTGGDQAIIDQLRALGYIEGDAGNDDAAREN